MSVAYDAPIVSGGSVVVCSTIVCGVFRSDAQLWQPSEVRLIALSMSKANR
jgi:hypothetical protein